MIAVRQGRYSSGVASNSSWTAAGKCSDASRRQRTSSLATTEIEPATGIEASAPRTPAISAPMRSATSTRERREVDRPSVDDGQEHVVLDLLVDEQDDDDDHRLHDALREGGDTADDERDGRADERDEVEDRDDHRERERVRALPPPSA